MGFVFQKIPKKKFGAFESRFFQTKKNLSSATKVFLRNQFTQKKIVYINKKTNSNMPATTRSQKKNKSKPSPKSKTSPKKKTSPKSKTSPKKKTSLKNRSGGAKAIGAMVRKRKKSSGKKKKSSEKKKKEGSSKKRRKKTPSVVMDSIRDKKENLLTLSVMVEEDNLFNTEKAKLKSLKRRMNSKSAVVSQCDVREMRQLVTKSTKRKSKPLLGEWREIVKKKIKKAANEKEQAGKKFNATKEMKTIAAEYQKMKEEREGKSPRKSSRKKKK